MSPQVSSETAPSELFEGGYYSIEDGDIFAIAKVLKLEPEVVHVRVYKQHFQQRPRAIDPVQLTLGTNQDCDVGVGHLPLRMDTFMSREPLFLTYTEVDSMELEAYAMWKEYDGGVWG
jgi:hypothetical protein